VGQIPYNDHFLLGQSGRYRESELYKEIEQDLEVHDHVSYKTRYTHDKIKKNKKIFHDIL